MKLKIYQVDAFTNKVFSGNPAAVCSLNKWPDDNILQNIAAENNLSETAFYVKQNNHYKIRWFTPTMEESLCGHATLATAYILFNYEGYQGNCIDFETVYSGKLSVFLHNDFLTLDFPSDNAIKPIPSENQLQNCFNIEPEDIYEGRLDYMFIFKNEQTINTIIPDFKKISELNKRGIIITAVGENVDFVSRFFCPNSGIVEDPVTGSAHTILTPYWAKILGKNSLIAKQLSKRGGYLECRFLNERVEISGQCKLYMSGEINF